MTIRCTTSDTVEDEYGTVRSGTTPSFRVLLRRRLIGTAAALALVLVGTGFAGTTPSAAVDPGDPADTVDIVRTATFLGCTTLGVCTVKLNKAETAALAAGTGVAVGALNVPASAVYSAVAAYAIESGFCAQLTVDSVKLAIGQHGMALVGSRMVRC